MSGNHRGRPSLLSLFLICASILASTYSFAQATNPWVGTWAAGISTVGEPYGSLTIAATTFRNNIHISHGGNEFRVKVSNEFGTDPLTVGQVTIGLTASNNASLAGKASLATFDGHSSVTIPPGANAVSDPIGINASTFNDVSVDIYIPRQTAHNWTAHVTGSSSNYMAPGDQAGETNLSNATLTTSWYFLKAVDVKMDGVAVVTLGDSITDGYRSTQNTNRRWPDILGAKLATSSEPTALNVLNVGISGNHVLSGGSNAMARLDRDVLTQSGAKYLIVFEGINDILTPSPADQDANDIISGLAQIAARAHQLGFRVYGATITPDALLNAAQQQERTSINQWIRSGAAFDAVIDFDSVVRNPASKNSLLPAYDSGDHLHPNDTGYRAMGNSINPALFRY